MVSLFQTFFGTKVRTFLETTKFFSGKKGGGAAVRSATSMILAQKLISAIIVLAYLHDENKEILQRLLA